MPDDRASDQGGSALLLMPTGVLVVVVLASLAVDAALVFTAQRQLVDAASAAANDAVTAGLDRDRFYECGAMALDDDRVRSVVLDSLQQRSADIVEGVGAVTLGRDDAGAPTVTVQVHGSVETIFARALPAGWREQTVTASATAVASAGPTAVPAAGCDP